MKYVSDVVATKPRPSAVRLRWGIGLVGCAVLFGLSLSRVRAQAHEALLRFGASAMAFPGVTPSEPRALLLNGIAVSLRTQVVDASLTETIRHYQNLCAGGVPTDQWYHGLVSALATRSATSDNDGYVACVLIESWSFSALSARVAKFIETWDVADLGAPRYVYASRASDAPKERTFVLTMWTDGPMNLRNLLPVGRKDAPGTDPRGVPRPTESQRILSATEISEHAGVFSYLVHNRTPTDVERDYRLELTKRSWRVVERGEGEVLEIDGIRILSAELDQRLLTVIAHRSARGGTTVTLLDWRGS